MSKCDFSKFDKAFNHESLIKEYEEAKKGNKDFPEIPDGRYEVSVKNMELKTSKKGDPMLTIQFKIVEGEFKNSMIFLNQVVTSGFGIHKANKLMREMAPGADIEWNGSFSLYADMIDNVFDYIKNSREYAISYSTTEKGYKNIEIDEIFELEN